jgi:hypothetical protein
MVWGGLKVFVEARKSIATDPEVPDPQLEVGLEDEQDAALGGLSEIKKFEPCF